MLLRGRSDKAGSSSYASLCVGAGYAVADIQTAVAQATTLSNGPAEMYPMVAWISSDRHVDRYQPRHTPISDCIASPSWPRSQHCVAHRASKVFFPSIYLGVDTSIICSASNFLSLALSAPSVRRFHAALFGTPLIKCRIADAMPAAKLLCAEL